METATKVNLKIKQYQSKSKSKVYIYYEVSGKSPEGTRVRKCFSELAKAKEWKEAKEIELMNGRFLHATVTRLSQDEIHEAESAYNRLGKQSLSKAVDFFLTNYKPVDEEIDLEDAVELFYWEKKKQIKPRTLVQLDNSMKHFRNFIGKDTKVHQITTKLCEDFLKSKGEAPKTWNNYRADIHNFFEFAKDSRRRWISYNPVADIIKYKIQRGMPDVLTLEQCKELMSYVENYEGGKLVPYFALCLFAGIRPAGEIFALADHPERDRLIDMENKVIHILPEISKTNQYRQVKIRPALESFLKAYPGPIKCDGYDRGIKEIRSHCNLGHDILRHTFYSMNVGAFKSVGEAAIEGGSSEYVVKKHYLNLKTTQEAEQFWGIRVDASAFFN
jgi:integrase